MSEIVPLSPEKLIQFKVFKEELTREMSSETIALRGGFGLSAQIEAIAKLANQAFEYFCEDKNVFAGGLALRCIETINKITHSTGEKPEQPEQLNQQLEYIKSLKNREVTHVASD